MLHLGEAGAHGSAYPFGGRVRIVGLRVLLFQTAELLHQVVVLRVGYDGVLHVVVTVVVELDLLA